MGGAGCRLGGERDSSVHFSSMELTWERQVINPIKPGCLVPKPTVTKKRQKRREDVYAKEEGAVRPGQPQGEVPAKEEEAR